MSSLSETIDSKNINDILTDSDDDIIDNNDQLTDITDTNDTYKIDNNIFNKLLKQESVLRTDKISTTKLTKYEKVRIIGERTNQLSRGAKPMIINIDNLTSQQIAEEELKNKLIPFKIKRHLPDNTYEIWKLSELVF